MSRPGAILHEGIVGTLRSAGTSFEDWCKRHGVHTSIARQATYGQMGGPRGQDLLERMIMEAKRLQGAAA